MDVETYTNASKTPSLRVKAAHSLLILVALVIGVFLALLIRYAQNIPATDDFGATLNFLHAYLYESTTTHERFKLFFTQHNEHRIAVSRLLALSIFLYTGKLNLANFLFVDALFLGGLLWLIFSIYKKSSLHKSRFVYLLPTVLLLSPCSYETFLFISGGSQAYPALFFLVLSLFLLNKIGSHSTSARELNSFALATLSAALATYSFGSGIVVWIGGLALLFYKKEKTFLVIWLIVSILAVAYYFYDYVKPIDATQLTLTAPFGKQLPYLLKGIILFPGSAFMIGWPNFTCIKIQVVLCYCIGGASWAYILYLFIIGYGYKNPLLFSLVLSASAIGLLLVLSRAGGGSGFLFISRYYVFTSLLPICLLAIFLDRQTKLLIYLPQVNVLFLGLFFTHLWLNIPIMEAIYKKRREGFIAWQRYNTPTLYIEPKLQLESGQIVKKSVEKHIFYPDVD